MADTEQIVEVDVSESDYGSTGAPSSTQSVTSSILEYVYENGRRYNAHLNRTKDSYTMPNDEVEQNRLDIVHHSQLLLLRGNLWTAPIDTKNIHRILDCGTGTGIWALDVGDLLPHAKVIGCDITPIQPSWTYPNVVFEVDDLEKSWTWPENHFDYIHSRMMNNAIHDWPTYTSQMFKHTAPGGYVEIAEHGNTWYSDDGTLTPESNVGRYLKYYGAACEKSGLKFPEKEQLKGFLEDAGFVDVTVKELKYPMGAWPKDKHLKECGATMQHAAETAFEAFGLVLLTKYTELNADQVKDLCKRAFEDVKSRKVHGYLRMWFIVGKKPEV